MYKHRLGRQGLLAIMCILLVATLTLSFRTVSAAPVAPVNGDFEGGSNVGWQEYSSNGYTIVTPASSAPVAPHSGNYLAWLGDAPNEVSELYQTITVTNNAHLSFWYWLGSGKTTCGLDYGYVLANSTVLQTWNLCTSTNTYSWQETSIDLSAYSGQTITLEFKTSEDANNTDTSGMLIDDVVLYNGTFTDVSLDHWANSYIQSLANAGITGGCNTTPLQYCPETTVTRAQMAVFLERGMHGSSFNPSTVPLTFTDTSGNFAQYWIEALKSDGITGGCGTGIYCPDSPVTRAQMAIFLLRSEHGSSYNPPPATGTKFTDVPASYWAASWIEQLANEGITGGCGTGTYCPDQSVTRAQMAVFLVKTFGLP